MALWYDGPAHEPVLQTGIPPEARNPAGPLWYLVIGSSFDADAICHLGIFGNGLIMFNPGDPFWNSNHDQIHFGNFTLVTHGGSVCTPISSHTSAMDSQWYSYLTQSFASMQSPRIKRMSSSKSLCCKGPQRRPRLHDSWWSPKVEEIIKWWNDPSEFLRSWLIMWLLNMLNNVEHLPYKCDLAVVYLRMQTGLLSRHL